MKDRDCVDLLQWALPRLHMRWRGFRKVHHQVCRKVQQRMDALGIEDVGQYRRYLDAHPREWQVLDGFLPITISRFWRDRRVFELLECRFLPELARRAQEEGVPALTLWSLGCGAGEEPYTFSILWRERLQPRFPGLGLTILASDVEAHQLARADQACYPASALKDLPRSLRSVAFERRDADYCLKREYRQAVELERRDIRGDFPARRFHLIACRYLAFTYFDRDLQHDIACRLHRALLPRGLLVLGEGETLPEGVTGFEPADERVPIYRRRRGKD
ncbi:CheR family methyltransferase [Halomonas beimenensis]|uniref:Chemotaxis protein methyltransferase CheR n=1 Tax=Halomonas beimenensis TaxID=475662 RepID=A0A291PB65_9GAMM|nr:CheR family methyltransferase [Halomonas beimenensis]ATJ84089.1 chemotaxis protein methyltransferase CheR [Halomonas beimenensis]